MRAQVQESLAWRPCLYHCPHCGEQLAIARRGDVTWYAHRFATWPVADSAPDAGRPGTKWLAALALADAVHAVADDPALAAALAHVRATRAGRNHTR